MSMERSGLTQWNVASVTVGGAVWATVLLLWLAGAVTLGDLDMVLLLAMVVIVPLVVPLVIPPSALVSRRGDEGHWSVSASSEGYLSLVTRDLSRAAIIAQPGAALCGAIALFAVTGSLIAGIAALIWLLFTALLGVVGLARIAQWLRLRRVRLADVCLALALIYLPIGGIWFALARVGIRPLGFGQTTVLLTAVHFHFITLAALVITGCTGWALRSTHHGVAWNVYRVAAVGMLICPLLVAAGITLTQLTGQRAVESGAAALLALSLIVVAILSLWAIVPTTISLLARTLLTVSGTAVFLTMALATAYAIGAVTHIWTITIPQMVAIHGWLNALAFGLCGLLGWRFRMAQDS